MTTENGLRATEACARRYVLRVDFSERNATLLDLARKCVDFDVRMEHLDVGDYWIDGGAVIERKTYADFAMSLADGRLFPQAAALARVLRFLAQQLTRTDGGMLRRYDRKPKRLASRKLYMLQGLPGVGPALANRLLAQFGSIERVVVADEEALRQVRGVGCRKAALIRALVG